MSGGLLDGGLSNNNNNKRGSNLQKSRTSDLSGKYRNRYQYQQQIDDEEYGDEEEPNNQIQEQQKPTIGQWKDRRDYRNQREANPNKNLDPTIKQRVLRQSSPP